MKLTPRRTLAVVVGLAVAAGGGALVGANFIKSPAQLAAEAQPPAAGPVTVPVEKRVIRTTMVLRGDVRPETTTKIMAPTPRNAAKPVVTRLSGDVGDTVAAGQVVAEVSGRPVIVLPGSVNAYRDITPGAKGDDVAQLQDALRTRGKQVNDPKGVYGTSTKNAVAALYKDLGYEAQSTSDGDTQAVKAAQRQVRDLQRAYDSAPDGKAAQALADAKEDLAGLEARTGATVPVGEIAFVPALPARITSRAVQQGSQVTGDLMTLAGGKLVVHADVDDREAQMIRSGMPVEIDSEMSGAKATGEVVRVDAAKPAAETPGEQQQAAPSPPGGKTVVVQTGEPLKDDLAGQNVRVTIIAASTSGEVLVVPLAAVSARDDGQAVVVRVVDGREDRVVVEPGVSGGGFVEVKPTEGSLGAQDRVVIGR